MLLKNTYSKSKGNCDFLLKGRCRRRKKEGQDSPLPSSFFFWTVENRDNQKTKNIDPLNKVPLHHKETRRRKQDVKYRMTDKGKTNYDDKTHHTSTHTVNFLYRLRTPSGVDCPKLAGIYFRQTSIITRDALTEGRTR